MVDNIKNGSPLVKVTGQNSPSTKSLRDSFKNLSSGLKVDEYVKNAPAVISTAQTSKADSLNKVLTGLKNAVAFSSKALDALEQVRGDNSSEDKGLTVVENIAKDLEGLRNDIGRVLVGLKRRAETTEVMQENVKAADSRVEDVEVAQTEAESTGSRIQFNEPEALKAHKEISLDKVLQLLADPEA